MSSLFKYFQETNGQPDGRQLFWHRAPIDGFPLRARTAPTLREEEAQELVQPIADAKVRVFNLANPEDLAEYTRILDRVVNGWYRVLGRERMADPETKNWRVLLEWAEIYGELPPETSTGEAKNVPH